MSINKLNFQAKSTGDTLEASEWNQAVGKIDELVEASNNGGGSGNNGGGSGAVTTEIDQEDNTKTHVKINNVESLELTSKGNKGTNVSLVSNNNINIEPRQALGTGDGKNDPTNANRKGGNIAFKPGDDIEFWGHHRGSSKNDEVSVKIMTEVPKASDPTKTDEVAAKLQLNAADIVLTSKDKQTESDEMNIVVNKAANTRGYLKVRAQAIDLRCEEHGGIALQPKGSDNLGHENKIKFEHDGGDGKEFATFNTQKTSIFTNQYRFNENGVIYPSTRGALETTYKVPNDPSSGIKKIDYPTQLDDFKDIYDSDFSCTWGELVKNTITGQKFYEDFNLNFSLVFDTYYTAGASYWPNKMTPARFNELKTLAGNTSTANIEIYTVNYLDSELFGGFKKYLSLEDIMENANYNYDEEDYAASLSPQQLQTTLNGLADNTLFAIHTDQNDVWICQKHVANPKFVINGQQLEVSDIITLINYFKTGAGKSQGPWANS